MIYMIKKDWRLYKYSLPMVGKALSEIIYSLKLLFNYNTYILCIIQYIIHIILLQSHYSTKQSDVEAVVI